MIISGKVKVITDLSVMIEQEETEHETGWKEWFPKSQCPDLDDVVKGEQVEFECPNWLAKQKGF